MNHNSLMSSKSPEAAPSVRPTHVAEVLKQRIREGTLAPGARLVEAKIAHETGTTRTHVREALQRLAGEGLVVIENFRGASVRRLDSREIEQIFATREMLEGLAARQAAHAPMEMRDLIGTLQSRLDQFESDGDPQSFALANEAWHVAIITAAANPYLQAFLERLWIPTYRLSFRRVYTQAIMARSNRQHRLVTAAIMDGCTEEAELAMRLHIRSGIHPEAATLDSSAVVQPRRRRKF
jgi:DNA-binding GntR family transcriptional regulator